MASTAEEALYDAAGSTGPARRVKYRDTIHLPIHQITVTTEFPALTQDYEIPEDYSDNFPEHRPNLIGSTRELIEDKMKETYLINAARFYTDVPLLQTFEAIFTIANASGDWRLISRNPFNVTKATDD